MKRHFKIFVFYLLLSCNSNSLFAQAQPVKFKIVITNILGSLKEEKFIQVTQDSVLAMLRDTTYNIQLSQKSKEKLNTLISSFELNKLEKKYWNKNANDINYYIFDIIIRDQSKLVTVHHIKVPELYELTKEINLLLPKQFKIGYNSSYFKN